MRYRIPHLIPSITIFAALLPLLASCSARKGGALYERERCGSCHSFKGGGGRTAPDLTAVTGSRSEGWIRQQITDPSKNSPRTRMPSYPHLSTMEIRAIINYLKG